MTTSVSEMAQMVKENAVKNGIDLADLVSEIKRSSLLESEAREIELLNELSQIRTFKLKMNKL